MSGPGKSGRRCFYLLVLVIPGIVSGNCRAQPFDSAPQVLRIMTWNAEWMFDDYQGDNRSALAKEQSAPNHEYWLAKVAGVASVIASVQPDIVALQEIEGDQTLAQIVAQIKSESQLSYRYAFIQGSDSFTEQEVGILMRSGLASYRRHEQSKAMFDSQQFYNLSKHLVAEFRWENVASPLTLMTVHFRATAQAQETRTLQAKLARHWLEPTLAAGQDVILLGDLNSEYLAGSTQGEIGAILGSSGPRMIDLATKLSDPSASTHLVLKKQFDRILVSESLLHDGPGEDWSFSKIEVLPDAVVRGKRDGPQHWRDRLTMSTEELDLSDHFPVMATFIRK